MHVISNDLNMSFHLHRKQFLIIFLYQAACCVFTHLSIYKLNQEKLGLHRYMLIHGVNFIYFINLNYFSNSFKQCENIFG